MRRTLHPTPRHLDDPLRLGPFTASQWVLIAVCALCVWLCLELLPVWVPSQARLSIAATIIGLPIGLVWAGSGERSGIFELPLRALLYLLTPREYVPGQPSTGPLSLTLVDGKTREVDAEDE